jgi:hypothetical protein
MTQQPLFDYTPAQWARIYKSLKDLFPPHTSAARLIVPAKLKHYANDYQRRHDDMTRQRARADALRWRRAGRLCDQLAKAIQDLEGTDAPVFLIEPHNTTGRGGLKESHRTIKGMLSRWARDSQWMHDHLVRPGKLERQYYFRLLSIWAELGGQLRRSVNPYTGVEGGPLIRFLQAAADPVLGPRACQASSIKHLLKEAKGLGLTSTVMGKRP